MLSKARQSGDFLAAIIDEALHGIIVIDETGIVLFFNRAASSLFDYAPEEVIGRNVRMLMPEPHCGNHDAYLKNYLETGEAKIIGIGRQVEGRRKDGSIFPMELGIAAVQKDGKRLFVGSTHDLSGRRKFDSRMQELHAHRVDLIEHMAVGLTHELKQPVAAVNGYLNVLSILLREQDGISKDILQKIIAQVLRMSEIIDNIRQFLALGVTDKTSNRLNEVVRTACEFTDVLAKEAGVTSELHLDAEDDYVMINKVQIQQVIVNLKRNAIEAMEECQKRNLTLSTQIVDGSSICVRIADTGTGLSEALKSRLFEPFASTKLHGLGVGLKISRSIIEAHHGKLWAEDNPGGGAVFNFVLPLEKQHPLGGTQMG